MSPPENNAPKPSPEESLVFQALVNWLADVGFDKSDVQRFLWGIAALSDLAGLRYICRRLETVLEVLDRSQPDLIAEFGMTGWEQIASKIARTPDRIAKSFGPNFILEAKEADDHFLKGKGATFRPIYVALPCISPIPVAEEEYTFLLGMSIAAEWEMLKRRTSLDHYLRTPSNRLLYVDDDQVVRAGLGLRHLSEPKSVGVVLKLPRPCSTDMYLHALDETSRELLSVNDPDVQKGREQLLSVQIFLRTAFDDLPPREWLGLPNNPSGGHPFVDGTLQIWAGKLVAEDEDDPDDDLDDDPDDGIDRREPLIKEKEKNLNRRPRIKIVEVPLFLPGVDPDPDEDRTEPPSELRRSGRLIFIPQNDRIDRAKTWRKLESRVRYIEVKNQMLPGAWQSLSDHEARDLKEELFGDYESIHSHDPEKRHLKEACVALLTCLIYGRNMSEIARLKHAITQSTELVPPLYVFSERHFVFSVPAPSNTDLHTYRDDADLRSHKILPDIQQTFTVPDHAELGELFKELQQHYFLDPSDRVFSYSTANLKRASRYLIPRESLGRRITLGMVERYVFNAATQQRGGDVAEATITTGIPHRLSDTALHYYAPIERVLLRKKAYFISDRLDIDFSEQDKSLLVRTNKSESVLLGHQALTKSPTIKAVFAELRDILCARSPWVSWDDYATYHNFYVLYSWLQDSYLNGIRAIRNPYIAEKECDPITGFARLSDKDNDRHYHSRLVWLPPVFWEQRRLFQLHLKAIALEARRRGFYESQQVDENSYFFLSSDHKVRLLSPGVFKNPGCFSEVEGLAHKPYLPIPETSIVRALLKLPLNLNRRYLRTALKEMGCPTESINAHLGHWNSGEEPWAPCSTYSMDAHRMVMQHHLGTISRLTDMAAVRSKLA
ncbi:MAG: hypothetical protein AABY95_03630 [Pseudomonadota bacterium]